MEATSSPLIENVKFVPVSVANYLDVQPIDKGYQISHIVNSNWRSIPFKPGVTEGKHYLSLQLQSGITSLDLFVSVKLVNINEDWISRVVAEKRFIHPTYPGDSNSEISECASFNVTNNTYINGTSYLRLLDKPAAANIFGKKIGLLIDFPKDLIWIMIVNPADNSVIWKRALMVGIQNFKCYPVIALASGAKVTVLHEPPPEI